MITIIVVLILVAGWLASQYMAYEYQKRTTKDLSDAISVIAEAAGEYFSQNK